MDVLTRFEAKKRLSKDAIIQPDSKDPPYDKELQSQISREYDEPNEKLPLGGLITAINPNNTDHNADEKQGATEASKPANGENVQGSQNPTEQVKNNNVPKSGELPQQVGLEKQKPAENKPEGQSIIESESEDQNRKLPQQIIPAQQPLLPLNDSKHDEAPLDISPKTKGDKTKQSPTERGSSELDMEFSSNLYLT